MRDARNAVRVCAQARVVGVEFWDFRQVCGECGDVFEQPPTGRPRRHCKDACKQRAYRERRSFVTPAPAAPVVAAASSADTKARWRALRKKTGLTDCELRRALVALQVKAGQSARARLGRLEVTEEDRRLFADDPGRRVAA